LKEPIFKELQAEDPDVAPTEVESMCVNCGENGITKLLLTKIPHYKEVILMSFNCDNCGYQNNEIQSGGMVQDLGIKYKVKIIQPQDLSRQIVKSDYASLIVPEIDLEVPPNSQKGTITTIEGVLKRTIMGLAQDQPVRRLMDPEGAKQIDDYVAKIESLLTLKEPFHVILSDPSGNSFVENPHAPRSDPHRDISHFLRSREQDHALALYTAEEVAAAEGTDMKAASEAADAAVAATSATAAEAAAATDPLQAPTASAEDSSTSSTTSSTLLLRCQEGEVDDDDEAETEKAASVASEATGMVALPRVLSASTSNSGKPTLDKKQQPVTEDSLNLIEEVLNFQTNCPNCGAPAETKMKVTNIPHFKEVVIMATVCDYCGHKTNEVKSGGGIESKGKRISLKVTDVSDMSRDVLKAETCSLLIPELEFEMGGYALGGRFTTLEGLLDNVIEQINNNPMLGALGGDSATSEQKMKIDQFKVDLMALKECQKPFTIILDDPAGNSYIQNSYAPDPDPEMIIDNYERSFEQNDDLGLNDMKTEDYGENDDDDLESGQKPLESS